MVQLYTCTHEASRIASVFALSVDTYTKTTTNSKRKSTIIPHTTFSSIMTYQQPPQTHNHDDTVEEASSLLTSVTASPAPSFSFGPGGGGGPATQMKNGGPTMRATIGTTCVLLGTLAMMYGRGHTPAAPMPRPLRAEDSAAALLRGHTRAAPPVYDPSWDMYCFKGNDFLNEGKHCWYPTHIYPDGDWKQDNSRGKNNCGSKCTKFHY